MAPCKLHKPLGRGISEDHKCIRVPTSLQGTQSLFYRGSLVLRISNRPTAKELHHHSPEHQHRGQSHSRHEKPFDHHLVHSQHVTLDGGISRRITACRAPDSKSVNVGSTPRGRSS